MNNGSVKCRKVKYLDKWNSSFDWRQKFCHRYRLFFCWTSRRIGNIPSISLLWDPLNAVLSLSSVLVQFVRVLITKCFPFS